MKLLLLITALASTLLAQQPQWEIAAGGKMSFEVASVKRGSADDFFPPPFLLNSGDAFVPTGGRFSAVYPLGVYIPFAYKLNLTPEQMNAVLATLPKRVSTDYFEIQARSDDPNTTNDQFRLMVQLLLADRFKLAVHFETQVAPVFAMTLAKPGKTGPALQPHREGTPCTAPVVGAARPRAGTCGAYYVLKKRDGMHVESHNTTLDELADGLGPLGRPVVNRTGLTGNFDFSLDWVPDALAAPNADVTPQGASFLAAIREQLGRKLESTKAPVRTLIVDHVERPTEN
jgi:uncharacterized protein (TIGR03435 family)